MTKIKRFDEFNLNESLYQEIKEKVSKLNDAGENIDGLHPVPKNHIEKNVKNNSEYKETKINDEITKLERTDALEDTIYWFTNDNKYFWPISGD